MAGGDDLDEGRGRYFSALYGGPQPSVEPSAQSPPVTVDDLALGDSRDMIPSPPAMSESPPDGMALIIVYQQRETAKGEPQFGLKVRCYCSQDPLLDLGVACGRPNLDLGTNIAPGGPQPADFLDRMGNWSYDQNKLAEWLSLHRHLHQDRLELVIRDDTGYRIPWELFWSPSVGTSRVSDDYLGAALTVTRWLNLKSYRPQSVKQVDHPTPYQAAGPVLAYIDEDMRHDEGLLADFEVEPAGSMQQLFNKLADERGGALAMVYVACHGEFSDDPDDCRLGRFPLGRATRRSDRLPRLSRQATLVFLNGCHTGSVGVDVSNYNDGAVRGFAVVFLRSGAAGVLATTGAVGRAEAGELAGTLFQRLRADSSRPVAEVLRQFRAAAAEEIAELLDDELPTDDAQRIALDRTLLPLLYPFMYVYFGSPRMLMSIAARGDAAEPGEHGGTGGQP